MIAGSRHYLGQEQVYVKGSDGHWGWVNERNVENAEMLKKDLEEYDFSLCLGAKRKVKQKTKVAHVSQPPEDILVNEGDDLFMVNVRDCPVETRGPSRRRDDKPIVSILGRKIVDGSVRWDVSLVGGERIMITHSELRRRNLQLFLEYAKQFLGAEHFRSCR